MLHVVQNFVGQGALAREELTNHTFHASGCSRLPSCTDTHVQNSKHGNSVVAMHTILMPHVSVAAKLASFIL